MGTSCDLATSFSNTKTKRNSANSCFLPRQERSSFCTSVFQHELLWILMFYRGGQGPHEHEEWRTGSERGKDLTGENFNMKTSLEAIALNPAQSPGCVDS